MGKNEAVRRMLALSEARRVDMREGARSLLLSRSFIIVIEHESEPSDETIQQTLRSLWTPAEAWEIRAMLERGERWIEGRVYED